MGRAIEGPGYALRIVDRTERCAATEVNPETGARDLRLPNMLRGLFGHADFGVYAEVIAGGRIAVGDELRVRQRRDG